MKKRVPLRRLITHAAHVGGDDLAVEQLGPLQHTRRPDLPVGQHHGVGGDDPTVELLIAHEPLVELCPRCDPTQIPEAASVGQQVGMVDSDRPHDVDRRHRAETRLGKRVDRGVEALVLLEEADAQEDVLGWVEAQLRPGLVPVELGGGGERCAVIEDGHRGALQTESVDQLVDLALGVHREGVDGGQDPRGHAARSAGLRASGPYSISCSRISSWVAAARAPSAPHTATRCAGCRQAPKIISGENWMVTAS